MTPWNDPETQRRAEGWENACRLIEGHDPVQVTVVDRSAPADRGYDLDHERACRVARSIEKSIRRRRQKLRNATCLAAIAVLLACAFGQVYLHASALQYDLQQQEK